MPENPTQPNNTTEQPMSRAEFNEWIASQNITDSAQLAALTKQWEEQCQEYERKRREERNALISQSELEDFRSVLEDEEADELARFDGGSLALDDDEVVVSVDPDALNTVTPTASTEDNNQTITANTEAAEQVIEQSNQNTNIQNGDDSQYAGEGSNLQRAEATAMSRGIGSDYPLIRVCNRYYNRNEIRYFEIDCFGFIPTCQLTIETVNPSFIQNDILIEGATISVFVQPNNHVYKSLRADFIVRSFSTTTQTPTQQIQPNKYTLYGELYIPNLYNAAVNNAECSGSMTSKNIIKATAKALGLGFFTNMMEGNEKSGQLTEEDTNDAQTWTCMSSSYPGNVTEEISEDQYPHLWQLLKDCNSIYPSNNIPAIQSYILHVTSHAWKNFKSFFKSWIDLRYAITFINVNKQLGEDGLDEKIDVVPIQKAWTTNSAKDSAATTSPKEQKNKAKEGKGKEQPKLLSNINGDTTEMTPFYVLKYKIGGAGREITDVIGIDKVCNYTEGTHTLAQDESATPFQFSIPVNETKLQNGFYIQIGPGVDITYTQGDVLASYVPHNKVVEGGKISDTQADSDVEQLLQTGSNMQSSGNHHKMYDQAVQHNKINNLQLQKKWLELTLNGINFALLRGEKVPALICNMDVVNQAMTVHPETVLQRGLIPDMSGWFIIDGIRYVYNPYNDFTIGTHWRTELKLVRREWPIPGKSDFPFILDEIRQSEIADGLDVITVDHTSGTVIESFDATKINETGQGYKDVTTSGLASFMVTLWDLIKKNIKGTTLIQGRWWAVDEEGKRADGLPWIVWDDDYKCMDESGKVLYMKTSVSNHFFGEAINVAYTKGTDELLKQIFDNNVILQYMYKNGISAYKETWVGTKGAVKTVHFGTNTSEQETFWNMVWTRHPETQNMYAAYYEWNCHNTADPRKNLIQENPAKQPKKEENNANGGDGNGSGGSGGSSDGSSSGFKEDMPDTPPQGDYTGSMKGKTTSEKQALCGIKGPHPKRGECAKQHLELCDSVNVPVYQNGTWTERLVTVNKALATDIVNICNEIKAAGFLIKSIQGLSRPRDGNKSYHPYGCAVDINPNDGCPYFGDCSSSGPNMMKSDSEYTKNGDKHQWTRSDGKVYTAFQKKGFEQFKIPATYDWKTCIWSHDHVVVKIFQNHGWGWGGKYGDTMHFSIFDGG